MSVMRSGITVVIDPAQYNRILGVLRNLSMSEERLIATAATRTARRGQTILSTQTKRAYEKPRAPEVKGRSTVLKGSTKDPGAEIRFRSDLPGITKFKYRPQSTPTRFGAGKKRLIPMLIKKGPKFNRDNGKVIYRWVGPKVRYPVTTAQVRGERSRYKSAFVTEFASGHKAVAFRENDDWESTHKRYPIKQVLGSSDRAMVGNEKVYGRKEAQIHQILADEVEKAITRALSKG